MPSLATTQFAMALNNARELSQHYSSSPETPGPDPRRGPTGYAAEPSVGTCDRESLYADFAPLVKRLLRQYGTDPEMRQDLAGEIYCRFCALLDVYDPDRGIPLRPYLVRQLSTSIYTYARSQWNLRKREAFLDLEDPSGATEPSYDPTPAWLSDLCDQEILNGLPKAIAQLPERQRKVVCWRYYDELPFDQIAGFLGVEPATVRSLLRHGLSSLRKRIQPMDAAPAGN
jgi:RNA polymerase sigma factor (sigma-70 family)